MYILYVYTICIYYTGTGNCIYVSISKYGSDTPVTRPETDKAGLSSRDRIYYMPFMHISVTDYYYMFYM